MFKYNHDSSFSVYGTNSQEADVLIISSDR